MAKKNMDCRYVYGSLTHYHPFGLNHLRKRRAQVTRSTLPVLLYTQSRAVHTAAAVLRSSRRRPSTRTSERRHSTLFFFPKFVVGEKLPQDFHSPPDGVEPSCDLPLFFMCACVCACAKQTGYTFFFYCGREGGRFKKEFCM